MASPTDRVLAAASPAPASAETGLLAEDLSQIRERAARELITLDYHGKKVKTDILAELIMAERANAVQAYLNGEAVP